MSGVNSCDCPLPPGGRAVCEARQMAICRVLNGQAETQCVDPPMYLALVMAVCEKTKLELPFHALRIRGNWALQHITAVRRRRFQRFSEDDRTTLQSGFFRDSETGELVTFRLPSLRVLRPKSQPVPEPSAEGQASLGLARSDS